MAMYSTDTIPTADLIEVSRGASRMARTARAPLLTTVARARRHSKAQRPAAAGPGAQATWL